MSIHELTSIKVKQYCILEQHDSPWLYDSLTITRVIQLKPSSNQKLLLTSVLSDSRLTF